MTESVIDPQVSKQAAVSVPNWMRDAIALGNEFTGKQTPHWQHNALNLAVFILIIGWLVGIGWLANVLTVWAYVPLAAVGFGWGYFALFILVVHEASHGMFLRVGHRRQFLAQSLGNSRFWNRFFGWLVCVPLGIDYVQHWEIGHRIHHRNPCRQADPQNCPSTLFTGQVLFIFLAQTLLIPGFIQFSGAGYHCPATMRYERNIWLMLGQGLFWLGLATSMVGTGRWQVLVAAFLGLQILAVLNLFKIAMEHGGARSQAENPFLRSASSLFPLRQLVMPLNISLHFEHHLHAGVPWYRLGGYHQALRERLPEEVRSIVLNKNGEVWQQICEPFVMDSVADSLLNESKR